jgi:hypothetical protein
MACSPESLRDNRFQLSETSPEAPTDPQGSSRHIELSTTTVVIEIVDVQYERFVPEGSRPRGGLQMTPDDDLVAFLGQMLSKPSGGCQVRLVVRSGVPEVAAEDTGPPIDRRRCDWP